MNERISLKLQADLNYRSNNELTGKMRKKEKEKERHKQ
jgi:hypothetical protein